MRDNALLHLKTLARLLLGRDPWVRPEVRLPWDFLGNAYGGWPVHLPALSADSIVYSFGIGEDVSFDTALIARTGATVHAFDPTPRSIAWLRGQKVDQRLVLHEFGLGTADGEIDFHPPLDPAHVSMSIVPRGEPSGKTQKLPVRAMESIMRTLGHERVDLVKMDIEGAEFPFVESLCRVETRPRQLLIEFHHRFPGYSPRDTRRAVDRLRGLGYRLFALSPRREEFAFIHEAGLPTAASRD